MAGDWIKMRTDIYRDPKVCLMAEKLMAKDGDLARHVNQNCRRDMAVTRNALRNATVGALVTVWGVTRHRGKRYANDLVVHEATVAVLDDIADLPGFGEAMASVGWVEETDEGLVFPNFFEEFNVEPSEEKKNQNAERQRRYREKRNALRNVTVAQQNNAREEKRREEKSNTKESAPDKPAAFSPKRFQKPEPHEVDAYAKSKGFSVRGQAFCDFYESKGWKVGGAPMKDWQAAVRTWANRDSNGVTKPKETDEEAAARRLQAWKDRDVKVLR